MQDDSQSPPPPPEGTPETPPPEAPSHSKFPPLPVREPDEENSLHHYRRQNATLRFIAWIFAIVLLLLVFAWAIQALL